MNDFSLLNLITIVEVFGAGSKRAVEIYEKIEECGLLNEEKSEILKSISFSDEIKTKLLVADYNRANDIIALCRKQNISIIKITDKDYPKCLKNIVTPPLILYYKGEMPDFNTLPSITIVGPRKSSDYGIKAAYSLGFRLARAGMIVVSGGALGCDTSAHKGAISAKGKTVMVLGCGIDADYLNSNKALRDETIKNGAIISEFPPLMKPTRFSFPVRNRVLSGLTLGTVVVEAKEKSGTLITARQAVDQGRDVFVIPGNPTSEDYKGSNNLLREGAKPLIDSYDIFNEYLCDYAEFLDVEKAFSKIKNDETYINTKKNQKNLQETLSKEAKIVYNYLDKQIFCLDDLSDLGLSADLLLSALTELELENLIKPIVGGKYTLI